MAKQCSGYGAVYFLAGLGLGAAAGLLLVPHSGEKTRQMINRNVERGKDYVASQQDAIRRSTGEFMAEGRRKAEGLKDKAKDWADRAGFARPSES